MSDCLFCKIIAHEIPAAFVYEDEQAVAFLDLQPVNPGHTLVITRRHVRDLLEAGTDEIPYLVTVVQRLAPAVMKTVGAPAFNLIQNNGADSGQAVPHLHFHLIPRHPGDGRGHWVAPSVDLATRKALAEKIRANL